MFLSFGVFTIDSLLSLTDGNLKVERISKAHKLLTMAATAVRRRTARLGTKVPALLPPVLGSMVLQSSVSHLEEKEGLW